MTGLAELSCAVVRRRPITLGVSKASICTGRSRLQACVQRRVACRDRVDFPGRMKGPLLAA